MLLLEAVQRRWPKNVEGIESLSYGDRLRFLNLLSVRERLGGLILLSIGRLFVRI